MINEARNKSNTELYLRVLKCLSKHTEGLTLEEISEKLEVKKDEIKWIELESSPHTQGKFYNINRNAYPQDKKYILSLESKAILLDHEELNHARRSSRIATYIAICALFLNVIFGIVQLKTPIEFDERHTNELIIIEHKLDSINFKLQQNNTTLENIEKSIKKQTKGLERYTDLKANEGIK